MTDKFTDDTINFILSRPFPNFEEYYYTKDNHNGYSGGVLVHCVRGIDNVNNIAKEGLLLKYNTSNYFTWAVNPYTQVKYSKSKLNDAWRFGAGTIIFTVPKGIFVETENDTEFGIYGDIPLDSIKTIDIPLCKLDNVWLSDVPSLIKDYGIDTVRDVCVRDCNVADWLSKENFYKLFEFGIRNSK